MLLINCIHGKLSAAAARATNSASSSSFLPTASNSFKPVFCPIHFFQALAMELCLSAYAMRKAGELARAALTTANDASRISMRAGFKCSTTYVTASLVRYCSVRPGNPKTMVKSPSLTPPRSTGKWCFG